MKKVISLIKVSLSYDMNIFKVNKKRQGKWTKIILPAVLIIYFFFLLGTYTTGLIKMLKPMHLEFVALTIFTLSISLFTFMEGIYKSSSLIFNCKDDNMLLSLPIKKSTVLWIRIFKFYVFELIYNSIFIVPSIVMYAIKMTPSWTYYLSSVVAIFLLPIVPIILSCIIGFIITTISSKFKGKNIFQTIFTSIILLLVMYISFNADGFVNDIVKKASSINDFITRLYYPVGAYISLVTDFKIQTLLLYIGIHLILLLGTVYFLGKIYFKVNSTDKAVLTTHKNKKYTIKSRSPMHSFIKKEFNRFLLTPVFFTNAGFGLILFVIACALFSIRFETMITTFVNSSPDMNIESLKNQIPLLLFGMTCFSAFMTSITSSMISLEGKSFVILKSLPIKPQKIVLYKILTALVIMIPCFIIGDIFVFINFKFDIISILLILAASFILPFLAELIGMLANLKYPKMDATNDTEVVKQSMSTFVATLVGMGLTGGSILLLLKMVDMGIEYHMIMLISIVFYGIVTLGLWFWLVKTCNKSFQNIIV